MNRLIVFFTKKGVFADLLTVFVLILGIISFILVRKEVFPNVKFDIITITTIFPGAAADESEKLVTNPIEQDLKEVDGIKKLKSTSTEGRSYITAQLDPDQTTESKGKSDIQDVVDRATDLPEGAEDPIVTSVESKLSPVIEISVAGNLPELELREKARFLEDEFETIPGVARIVSSGLRDLEVRVEADQKKLARYRVSLDDVVGALKNQNISVPGGSVDLIVTGGGKVEKAVRTIGDFETPEDVGNTVVRANDLGQSIRVKDVARVSMGLEELDVATHTDGLPSITLTLLKKEKADVIQVVDALREHVEKLRPGLKKDGVTIKLVNDLSMYVRRRLSILSNNLTIGLILVLFVLSLIMPFRVALVASMGIPFSFLGAMIYFYFADASINLISMMGLIIVCGMLVDDAIVVTDNAVRLMEEGHDPKTAAIKGTQQVWGPVTASVATTIVAFLPLMFMSGIFGKFIRQIPLSVIIALIVSLIEVFFIMPHHIAKWIVVNKNRDQEFRSRSKIRRFLKKTERFWDDTVTPAYIKILRVVLRRRYRTLAGIVALFIASVGVAVGVMRITLFPPEGVEIFMIRADAAVGTGIERSKELIKPIEDLVGSLPPEELDNYITTFGIQQQDANDPFTKRGKRYTQIKVYLSPENERDRRASDIIEDLKKKSNPYFKDFERLTFERVNPGPPQGKPISLGVRGKEYKDILVAIAAVKEELKKIEGVSDISDSYVAGTEEIIVNVKGEEAAAARLNVASIGNTVRAAYEGVVATTIKKLDEDIDVRVTLSDYSKSQRSSIRDILIPNPAGNLVPLSRVASFSNAKGIAVYQHEANRRQVSVTAEIDTTKMSSKEANNIIRSKLPELNKRFPGISISFGGEDEDTQESLVSMFVAFGYAAFSIFLILVFLFGNLLQPLLIIFGTIPLGFISVVWIFFIHGMPFSFMGMLGIVALAGVIVNNAIVLVDFVNQARKDGVSEIESIIEGARKRVRPIFLTTTTTVAGLLPTAYGLGGLDKFVVPIAMALGWGMLLGSVLTAFIFPSAIAILDDLSKLLDRIWEKFQSKVGAAEKSA